MRQPVANEPRLFALCSKTEQTRRQMCIRDRPKTHRHGRELPEVGQQAGVRVAWQPASRVRVLLTETVELLFAETALKERARVDAGGGVALNKDCLLYTSRCV